MNNAKQEVLRYLGHKGQEVTAQLDALVDDCMAECRAAAKPLHACGIFDAALLDNGVQVAGTTLLLRGADIRRHLERARQVAVMAVTLGAGVDALIRRWEFSDLTRSLLLDACATQLIEEVCDKVEAEVAAQAKAQGLLTNFRYSPGYGDLPLDVQSGILAVLNAGKRIGLTCTSSSILLPRKSVTAFIGLLPHGEMASGANGCATCNLRETCTFRKDGDTGGCNRYAKE